MELSKFLVLVTGKERRISITNGLYQHYTKRVEESWHNVWYEYMSWEVYFRLADLTKHLDYGCDFNELGCKAYRFSNKEAKKDVEKEFRKTRARYSRLMCCCGGCRAAFGYLSCLPNGAALKQIAKLFHNQTGFWRKDKGCVLPRKYRSYTCLRYACRGGIKPLNSGKFLLDALRRSEKDLIKEFNRKYPPKKSKGNLYRGSWTISGIIAKIEEDLLAEIEQVRKGK